VLCRVLTPTTSQESVFSSVSDVIQSALDGYHVCLFSYGQTGSGKTYTMNGNQKAPGIIPRAVSMLLESSEKLGAVGWTFRLEATFIEVYNDVLRDLLAPARSGSGAVGADARVLDSAAIKHDPKAHTQVCLLSYVFLEQFVR
jgi:kinesin family member C1